MKLSSRKNKTNIIKQQIDTIQWIFWAERMKTTTTRRSMFISLGTRFLFGFNMVGKQASDFISVSDIFRCFVSLNGHGWCHENVNSFHYSIALIVHNDLTKLAFVRYTVHIQPKNMRWNDFLLVSLMRCFVIAQLAVKIARAIHGKTQHWWATRRRWRICSCNAQIH